MRSGRNFGVRIVLSNIRYSGKQNSSFPVDDVQNAVQFPSPDLQTGPSCPNVQLGPAYMPAKRGQTRYLKLKARE